LPHFRPLFPTLQALIALIAAGCALGDDGEAAKPKPATSVLVDERAGVLRGVRFGDSLQEVLARLGPTSDAQPGVFPAGADYTGPPSIPSPPSDARIPANELHYEDTAYLVSPTVGVFSMVTLAEGARTRAGVGIGDDLERVRKVYNRVDCGETAYGEGSDYPWCRVLGDIHVFFGEDPIESITLSSTAARG
jgi:hypothetical protein